MPLTLEITIQDNGTPVLRRFGTEVEQLGTRVNTGATVPFQQATQSGDQFLGSLGGIAKGALVAAAAFAGFQGLSALFTSMATTAAGFEAALANVNTLGIKSIETQRMLRDQLLQLPPLLGDTITLAKGLYEVISAGIAPQQAVKFLADAALLAKAGLADLSTTVEALTKSMAAFNMPASEASRVADILFTTVEIGQGSLQKFAHAMPQVTQIAASMGVTFLDTNVAMATLSQTFRNADTAATGFRSLLVQLIQNADQFAAVGINIQQVIGEQGLVGVFKVLQQVTGGNSVKMKTFINDTEGLAAAMALTGPQFKTFLENQEKFAESTGKVAAGAKLQAATASDAWKSFTNSLGQLTQDIAPPFLTAFTTIVKGATSAAEEARAALARIKAPEDEKSKDYFEQLNVILKTQGEELAKNATAANSWGSSWLGVPSLMKAVSNVLTIVGVAHEQEAATLRKGIEATLGYTDAVTKKRLALQLAGDGLELYGDTLSAVEKKEIEAAAATAAAKVASDALASAIQGLNLNVKELALTDTPKLFDAKDLQNRIDGTIKNLNLLRESAAVNFAELDRLGAALAQSFSARLGSVPPAIQQILDDIHAKAVAGQQKIATELAGTPEGLRASLRYFGSESQQVLAETAERSLAHAQNLQSGLTSSNRILSDGTKTMYRDVASIAAHAGEDSLGAFTKSADGVLTFSGQTNAKLTSNTATTTAEMVKIWEKARTDMIAAYGPLSPQVAAINAQIAANTQATTDIIGIAFNKLHLSTTEGLRDALQKQIGFLTTAAQSGKGVPLEMAGVWMNAFDKMQMGGTRFSQEFQGRMGQLFDTIVQQATRAGIALPEQFLAAYEKMMAGMDAVTKHTQEAAKEQAAAIKEVPALYQTYEEQVASGRKIPTLYKASAPIEIGRGTVMLGQKLPEELTALTAKLKEVREEYELFRKIAVGGFGLQPYIDEMRRIQDAIQATSLAQEEAAKAEAAATKAAVETAAQAAEAAKTWQEKEIERLTQKEAILKRQLLPQEQYLAGLEREASLISSQIGLSEDRLAVAGLTQATNEELLRLQVEQDHLAFSSLEAAQQENAAAEARLFILDRQSSVLSDQLALSNDLLAAQGLTQATNETLLRLQVQRDRLAIAQFGALSNEQLEQFELTNLVLLSTEERSAALAVQIQQIDAQIAQENARLRLAASENDLANVGLELARAQLVVAQDTDRLSMDTVHLKNAGIDYQLQQLDQQINREQALMSMAADENDLANVGLAIQLAASQLQHDTFAYALEQQNGLLALERERLALLQAEQAIIQLTKPTTTVSTIATPRPAGQPAGFSPGALVLGRQPGFAEGTPFVPSTMLALLHRGERVVPASENAPRQATAAPGGSQITIALSVTLPPAMSRMEAQTFVNQITPALNEAINRRQIRVAA